MKKRNRTLMCALTMALSASAGLLSCNSDKDKNGLDDRIESQGTYRISVPGHEGERQESITISNVRDEFTGTLSGSVYASIGKTFYFHSQSTTMKEYEGNIWYAWVTCIDGVKRRIYFRRTGIGSYLGSGNVTLGGQIMGTGASVGFGWNYSIYNEYGRITYCIYDKHSYTK